MPITLTLRRADGLAEVLLAGSPLGAFEPAALLDGQPRDTAPAALAEYGGRLFAALGGDALRALLDRAPAAPDPEGLLALQTDDPALHAVPWELLHDGADFLIHSRMLVREVPGAPPSAPVDSTLPWRLIALGSDPLVREERDPQSGLLLGHTPLPRLRVAQEQDRLRDELRAMAPPAPIRWQRIAPTHQALIDDLATSEPLLFHYTGHGGVTDGVPLLFLDDGTGCADPCPAAELAAELRGQARFAFLNACRTADSREPDANLALALVRGGIPAVLGAQFPAQDEAAALFATSFYRALAAGRHPAEALYRARRQLRTQFPDQPLVWAAPVLYGARGHSWQVQRPPLDAPLPPLEPPAPQTAPLRGAGPASGLFVGRDREQLELARLFVHDGARIVTVRGPGGMGKTALVHTLAERLRFHFTGGILAHSLFLPGEQAALSAAAVRRALAELLGLRHPAFEQPDAAQAQEDALAQAVRARPRLLLIWDNYETVLWRLGRDRDGQDVTSFPAEQRAEAAAVQRLVRVLADGGAHLLFTTRQSPVGLPGEVCYPPAAQGHQLGGLRPEDSLRLLRTWAGQRVPSEGFLTELAAQLDHHPLALGLAAARWGRGHTEEAAFLANLRAELAQAHDPAAPMYQQSSVAINLRLSLNALPEYLRAGLLALTVIANPVIVPEHAAAVWGMLKETEEAINYLHEQAHEQLEQLHAASLLQGQGYQEGRNRAESYSLHPVVAAELARLAEGRDLRAERGRYADWAKQWIAMAYNKEGGIDASAEVAQATSFFLPDLAAALPLLPADKRGQPAWTAAWVFERLGRPEQAQQSLRLAESATAEQDDPELHGHIVYQQARLLVTHGDLDGAMRLYQQSLDIKQALGDIHGKSATLHQMANVLVMRGDLDGATQLYQQSLDIYEALSDVRGKGIALHAMAYVVAKRGDLDGAMQLYQQSLDIRQTLGDMRGKGTTLLQMANVLVTRGDLDRAMQLYQQSLDIYKALDDVLGKSTVLHEMAGVQATRGDLDRAMQLYQQSLDVYKALGNVRGKSAALNAMANVQATRGDLDGAIQLYQQSLNIKEALGDVQGKSVTLANMAVVQFRQGDHAQALRNARASLELLQRMGAAPDAARVASLIQQMEEEMENR
ncbi:MAG TPA: tetratricopeptide repeat protein [Roseiflexaceae bacterium]|nr:tetratricopeptide repeat protein [Roseiflexaceae bacterium]